MYTVSQKNDCDVAYYDFNAHQPILVIFGRYVNEGVGYWMMTVITPLLTNVFALPVETWTPEIVSLQLYHVSKTSLLWLATYSTIINQF